MWPRTMWAALSGWFSCGHLFLRVHVRMCYRRMSSNADAITEHHADCHERPMSDRELRFSSFARSPLRLPGRLLFYRQQPTPPNAGASPLVQPI